MNYKKSLLSLVTIMALSNMAVADDAATYLPLSSKVTDSVWNLFGVNGFSNGVPSAVSSGTSSFSAGLTSLADIPTTDELATPGLSNGGNLASLQALLPATPVINTLSVGVDISTTAYNATEPVRSMYMKVGSTSIPNVKFNYKASLEGKAIEILFNGTLYSATIAESSTWANALTATLGSGAVVATTDKIKTVTGVLDFNTTDNPVEAKYFNASTQLLATGATASFYHFNAITQQWEVNQKNATVQDFTSFTAGKAYWGRADRLDALGSLNPDQDGATGLILGQATALSGIPDPAMYQDESNASTLTAGWNMLSFDDHQPYIRHAATGLVLTSVANGSQFVITDDSGVNSITASAIAGGGNNADAMTINAAIESAKLLGSLPQTFNIKAFQGSGAGTMIFLSDRKFTIGDANATATNVPVATLDGAQPYVNGVRTTVADINNSATTSATSAYGEYTTIVNVLTGAGTSDSILTGGGADATGAKLTFTSSDTTTGSATANITASLTNAANAIHAILGSTPTATQIDTNFDGTADMLIVANTTPYTLKDATYTRVFADTNTTAGNVTVSGTANTVVASGATLASLVTNINAVAATTLIDANATLDTVPKLVAVTNAISTFDIKDVASGTVDILSASSTAGDLAKGAVAGVYSLDSVARLPLIQHSFVSPLFDPNLAVDTNVTINATTATITAPALGTTIPTRLAYFDALVAGINNMIQNTLGVHGSASHNYSAATNNITDVNITVAGLGVTIFDINNTSGAGATNVVVPDTNAATAGKLGSGITTGDLVADLKTNPIASPNYATYGPLYTLRNAGTGYDVRAILKATTELDTNTTSAIAWDSIDITRNESEWFLNNEFNLFNINHNAGYWVYLENKTPDAVSIVSATFTSPAYTYYFSNAAGLATTNIMNSGQISVTITGLSDAVASSAYLTVGGEDVPLTRSSPSSNIFTADVSSYALRNFAQDQTGPISITVRAVNGKGQAVTASGVVSIDYQAPVMTTPTVSGGTSIILGATGTTSNFYVFNGYVPEVQATRTTAVVKTLPASGNAATFNACTEFDFGVDNTLRIVAADGAMNTSNVSDAKEIIYASLLKGATVLTHTQGVGLKSQIGSVYNSACVNTATQTLPSENAGVSLATLASGATTRLSFVPIANANFTQDVAWTANYSIGGTRVAQIQNVVAYASAGTSHTFFLEYNGHIYRGTFPTSQAIADASIATPIALTQISAVNTSLVP
ncbi:MAG: hypothetical protein NTW78_00835 [Campylobacterales bacterium]|nr:hypothetical protein [Campylobacterales bacterium]